MRKHAYSDAIYRRQGRPPSGPDASEIRHTGSVRLKAQEVSGGGYAGSDEVLAAAVVGHDPAVTCGAS